jgi:hypothetical protein
VLSTLGEADGSGLRGRLDVAVVAQSAVDRRTERAREMVSLFAPVNAKPQQRPLGVLAEHVLKVDAECVEDGVGIRSEP